MLLIDLVIDSRVPRNPANEYRQPALPYVINLTSDEVGIFLSDRRPRAAGTNLCHKTHLRRYARV